jgi:two-component system, chemotaxis family, response regulator Rcp1
MRRRTPPDWHYMYSVEFIVLLIEPDASSVDQLRESLTEGAMRSTVYRVASHWEAIAFLNHAPRQQDRFDASPRPDAIVISSNLPPADIVLFEQALRSEPQLRKIPVIKLLAAAAEKKHTCHHRSQAA